MATRDELLPASFGGVAFEFRSVEDSGGHAHAAHRYPGVDGADLEPLGLEADTHSLTAVFLEPGAEAGWALLRGALMAGLDELVHPVFGSVEALCTRWQARRELSDKIEVTLEFTVNGTSLLLDTPTSFLVVASELELALLQAEELAP